MTYSRASLRRFLSGAVLALLLPDLAFAEEPKPQTGHPSEQSLQAQATNPNAPLIQMSVFNTFVPSSYGGEGYSNQLLIQPVIPIAAQSWFPVAQILRPSLPILTTPGPDRVTGLGDFAFFDVFVPDHYPWGSWGLGVTAVFPTATDDRLGAGKWQLGPAATLLFQGIENLQLGMILQNPISFAGDGDRPGVNMLLFQPIAQYNLPKGWYVGMGDFTWLFDWKDDGAATIPLALQVGRVLPFLGQQWNLGLEGAYTVVHPGPAPRWSIRLGISLLLPK